MSCRRVATHSLLALVVVISFLTAADRTVAAMWAVLTLSPERPAAEKRTEVLIRTFAAYGPDAVGLLGHDGPIPAPSDSVLVIWGVDYPFQLVALGPDSQRIDIEVHQDPSDASLHRGTVAFPRSGTGPASPCLVRGHWCTLIDQGCTLPRLLARDTRQRLPEDLDGLADLGRGHVQRWDPADHLVLATAREHQQARVRTGG